MFRGLSKDVTDLLERRKESSNRLHESALIELYAGPSWSSSDVKEQLNAEPASIRQIILGEPIDGQEMPDTLLHNLAFSGDQTKSIKIMSA